MLSGKINFAHFFHPYSSTILAKSKERNVSDYILYITPFWDRFNPMIIPQLYFFDIFREFAKITVKPAIFSIFKGCAAILNPRKFRNQLKKNKEFK